MDGNNWIENLNELPENLTELEWHVMKTDIEYRRMSRSTGTR